MDTTLSGWIGIALWVLGFIIAVLWVLMPFAIFGTKPLMRELIAEQRRTNRLLEEAAQRAKMNNEAVLVTARKVDPLYG
jgi:hypothetical protein